MIERLGESKDMSEARKSSELLIDYHAARFDWAAQIAINQDYFLGKQWTDKERKILNERGQAALVIDRIFCTIQQKLAQLTQHRPVLRALPVESNDQSKSEMWNMVLEYTVRSSHGELVEMEIKRDHLVKTVGYYYVYWDKDADDGRGEVLFCALTPETVYIDPNSRRPDYSDADSIIVTQVYTLQQAKNMFPGMESAIDRAKTQLTDSIQDYIDTELVADTEPVTRAKAPERTLQEPAEKVRLIERFTKRRIPFYIVQNEADGALERVDEETYEQSYKDNPGWSATRIERLRVERIVSAGEDTFLFSEVMPLEDYPVIPVPNVWIGTPYPLSDVTYMRGIQDEINKRRSLMILHQTSTASSKWIAEEGSIDVETWMRKSSVPGAVLTYRAAFNAPKEVFAAQMPNGLFSLEQEAKADIERVSGVFGISHGDPSGAPETYGATLALEEYANRRIAPSIEMLSYAKKILGRCIIRMAQHYYRVPKFIRIVGNDDVPRDVLLNNPNDPQSRYSIDQARYDVEVEVGKFTPTNRMAQAQFMLDLASRGIVDNQAVLEVLDIPDKQKIIERLSTVQQQGRTIQALQDELKRTQGQLQSAHRELQHAGIKAVVDESRTLEKEARNEHKANMREQEDRLELAVDKATLQLKALVDAEKARQQIEQARRTSAAGGAGAKE